MKPAILIATTVAATLAVGALYCGLGLTNKTRPRGSFSPRMESAPGSPALSSPATFANLPANATGDQTAKRIHALGRNVPPQEQAALAAWIAGPKPAQFKAPEWLYLANEVMDSLCHQSSPFPEWSTLLTDIACNRANDSGLRDYSIQHMVDRLQPMDSVEPCETDPTKREAMINAMRDAAGDAGGDLAGTALMGLHHILQAREYSEARHETAVQLSLPFSSEALRPLAVKLAAAPQTTMQSRVTALQVCAERRYGEALPESRTIARDPKQPSILRLSAIAAIGQLGNADDEQLLKTLQDKQNPRLLKGLQPALKKIQQRTAAPDITAS